jgi:hypothetical protein
MLKCSGHGMFRLHSLHWNQTGVCCKCLFAEFVLLQVGTPYEGGLFFLSIQFRSALYPRSSSWQLDYNQQRHSQLPAVHLACELLLLLLLHMHLPIHQQRTPTGMHYIAAVHLSCTPELAIFVSLYLVPAVKHTRLTLQR